MQDGRVSFTAEKATAEFYQLSGRRINWDLTDYHPLLAQRATSTDTFTADVQPSVDYQQATEIREGLDRNFVFIMSDAGARGGGGALATFNRSIGPFQADRTEVTFLRAVVIVDPAATGKDGTAGVYRSPFSLPNGEILASYAANVTNPASDTPKFDLVAVNERTGARRPLASDGSLSYVEAALGYKRAETMLFNNVPQLVFGGHTEPGRGRDGDHAPARTRPCWRRCWARTCAAAATSAAMDKAVALKVYEELPPPSANPGGLMGTQQVYTSRTSLGKASFESDHSLKVFLPAGRPLILEFVDGNDSPVLTMTEEHQLTRGRIHHARAAARAVQSDLRRLPRQRQRVRAGRGRQPRRADRRVGVAVAQSGRQRRCDNSASARRGQVNGESIGREKRPKHGLWIIGCLVADADAK